MKHIRRYKIFESKSDVKDLLNDLVDFDDVDVEIKEYESNHGKDRNIEIKIDKGLNGYFTMTDLLKSTLIRFNNVMSADWTIAYKYRSIIPDKLHIIMGELKDFSFDTAGNVCNTNGYRLLDEKIWFIKILMQEKK